MQARRQTLTITNKKKERHKEKKITGETFVKIRWKKQQKNQMRKIPKRWRNTHTNHCVPWPGYEIN